METNAATTAVVRHGGYVANFLGDGIIAYLRSLKPVSNKVPDPIYKMALPHHIFPGAEKPYTQAALSDKLTRGRYFATIGHCMECHTPFKPGGGPDLADSLGKGGRAFEVNEMGEVRSWRRCHAHEFPAVLPGLVQELLEQQDLVGILNVEFPHHVLPSHMFWSQPA